jgi:isopentenyl diphosphate isomerase/L-lactate dehydrogenase-like FMN-dependent dehydrogenase
MRDLAKQALNIEDLRLMAKRRLTKALFDFCDRGSEEEIMLRDNRAVLDSIKLLPRQLVDTSDRDPGITLFGKRHKLPILIGPTGISGWTWYRAEIAMARAAAAAGVPFTLASSSNTPMERVKAEGGGTQWFHLYVWRDVEAAMVSVDRARDAGFEALVVTVDSPTYNNREIDIRNGATLPPRVTLKSAVDSLRHPRWLFGTMLPYMIAERGMPGWPNIHIPEGTTNAGYGSGQIDSFMTRNASLTWDWLKRVRDRWPGTLLVKGILHPDDAVLAADCGADGIFVSNHAGNVLDAAALSMDMLPHVRAAVGDRLTIIVDSGFRRGSDVLKGLALGADAVAVGRASLYGVGAAGEAGVARALAIFDAEIRRTMGNLGVRRIADITRAHVLLPGEAPVWGQAAASRIAAQ